MGLNSTVLTADPSTLPITPYLASIDRALDRHGVVIVCGATGSGKSTQVPQLCLARHRDLRIGHTQPRRLAARAVAQRIASERGERLGDIVGYQTRFVREATRATRLKLMTDGILLQEIARDRELSAYDMVLVDEVHERSLNIDFILGYLRTLLPRRPDLRVVLMSATIDAERFRDFFGHAEVIEIPGATYPIDLRYRPLALDEEGSSDLCDGIVQAIHELDVQARGDILVFLPGEREIAEAAAAIRGANLAGTEVLPLFARLGLADQQKVFSPHSLRHIVLATNVAETSVTVPGIRHVIDSGLARLGSYSPRSKLQRLPVGPISQASAEQRKGRCGRERPGCCIRLYSAEQFARRPRYTEPELRRSNLAAVILRLADLALGPLDEFPLLDAPTTAAVNDGYLLLRELGALDHERLTPVGHQLARIPLDPRLAKMVIAAAELDCVREILIIVSALSAGDVRERPRDARIAADAAHQRFRDHRSDFLWFVAAWEVLQQELLPLSRHQQQAYCRTQYWSWRRLREWIDLHRELTLRCSSLGLTLNAQPAAYRAIHQALLAGLISRIARWEDKTNYLGCRQQRMRLHPSTAVRAKPPKWIVAAEITETTATYARMVAKIDPSWAARAAGHLVKRNRSEPIWDPDRGEAYVLEEQALYGLTLIHNRRVAVHQFDQARARAVLIAQGLVAGRLGSLPEFLSHNLALAEKIRAAEARARRRDLLTDDQDLAAFYDARIPTGIGTRRQLTAWLRSRAAPAPTLRMTEDIVTRNGIAQVTEYLYPDVLERRGMQFPLNYRFAPGETDDGVTVTVPLAALTRATPQDFERLVPGLLSEKIAAMIKRLPKERRRYLAPLAEYAPALTAAIEHAPGSLAAVLSAAVARMTGLVIPVDEWRSDELPAHLQLRIRLLDGTGEEIAVTRDLSAWLRDTGTRPAVAFQALPWATPVEARADWTFGTVPESISVVIGGVAVVGYPALQAGPGVALTILHDAQQAQRVQRDGVRQLLMDSMPREVKQLRKEIRGMPMFELQAQRLKFGTDFANTLLVAAFNAVLASGPLPRNASSFEHLQVQARATVFARLTEWVNTLQPLFEVANDVLVSLLPATTQAHPKVRHDVEAQLQGLFKRGLACAEPTSLQHYPRYLRGVRVRLERLLENPQKDARKLAELETVQARADAAIVILDPTTQSRVHYLVEELRVSFFAPSLRTAEKVSVHRINEFLMRAIAEREERLA